MIRKAIVAILSSIVLCLVLAWMNYTPIALRQPDTWYEPFFSLFMIYMIYALPVYLLGGIPSSMLIDCLQRKITISNRIANYFVLVLLYAIAGFLCMLLIFITISDGELMGEGMILYGGFGSMASLTYYHVLIITNVLVKPIQPSFEPFNR